MFRAVADMGGPFLARDRVRHDPADLGRFVLLTGRHRAARRLGIRPLRSHCLFLRARLDPRLHSAAAPSAHLWHALRRHNST